MVSGLVAGKADHLALTVGSPPAQHAGLQMQSNSSNCMQWLPRHWNGLQKQSCRVCNPPALALSLVSHGLHAIS